MSQDDMAVVRSLYERFPDLADAARAEAVIRDLIHPSIHLDMTRRVLNPASYDGHEGMAAALADVREIWERFVLRPERFIEVGDEVLVVQTAHGRGRGGVDVVNRGASLYALEGGKIVRMVFYEDPSAALQALGVPE